MTELKGQGERDGDASFTATLDQKSGNQKCGCLFPAQSAAEMMPS